jgi:membrane protease subunit (stomatin/prohibitin family)
MGLLNKLKGEFIDIIEWLDPTNDTMVFRFVRGHDDNEIKNGAKLVCRETQTAVFINEGQIADVFAPGTYTLSTQNLPILSTLKGWKYGFNSPFKAEVYFVNTKNFTNNKWGTKNPVMMRDPDFGIVRVRAFGNYVMRVKDAAKFIKEIVGTDGNFKTDEITEQFKSIAITRFTDYLGESKVPVLDLAAKYDEISKGVMDKLAPEFEEYGIEITKFLVENISLPPEVEAAMDKRASMGAIGNLGAFQQYQTAIGIEEAAKNPGGMAGAGVGMGMGFAMANQMGQNMGQQQQQQQQAPPPTPIVQYFVSVNGQQQGPYNDQSLAQMLQQGTFNKDTMVWKQGMAAWLPAGQVPELASVFNSMPPPPPPPPPAQ